MKFVILFISYECFESLLMESSLNFLGLIPFPVDSEYPHLIRVQRL